MTQGGRLNSPARKELMVSAVVYVVPVMQFLGPEFVTFKDFDGQLRVDPMKIPYRVTSGIAAAVTVILAVVSNFLPPRSPRRHAETLGGGVGWDPLLTVGAVRPYGQGGSDGLSGGVPRVRVARLAESAGPEVAGNRGPAGFGRGHHVRLVANIGRLLQHWRFDALVLMGSDRWRNVPSPCCSAAHA